MFACASAGTLDECRLRDYLDSGVTRFSLGVQTFHEPTLKRMGRLPVPFNQRSAQNALLHPTGLHSQDSLEALKLLRREGLMKHTSADIIWGMQSESQLFQDLQTLVEFGVGHISLYELQVITYCAFAGAVERKGSDCLE